MNTEAMSIICASGFGPGETAWEGVTQIQADQLDTMSLVEVIPVAA